MFDFLSYFPKKTNIKPKLETFQPSNKLDGELIVTNMIVSPNLCMYEAKELINCIKNNSNCREFLENLKKCQTNK